jgi:hypothetical protein
MSTANAAFAKSVGAGTVIDYKTQRFEDYAGYDLEMIYDLTDGESRSALGDLSRLVECWSRS